MTPLGPLNINFDFSGFSFERNFSSAQINCKEINKYHSLLYLSLMNFENDDFKKRILKDCKFDNLYRLTKILIDINLKHKKNNKTLKSFLKNNKISSKRMAEIERLYENKKRIREEKTAHSIFSKKISEIQSRLENKRKIKFSTIDNMQYHAKGFLNQLLEIYYAAEKGNQGWAKRGMNNILKRSYEEIIFDINGGLLKNKKERDQFNKDLISFLHLLEKTINKSTTYKMFLNYFSGFFDARRIHDLKKRNDAFWTLPDLWKRSSSVNYGIDFLGFWAMLFYKENLLISEEYLTKFLQPISLEIMDKQFLWTTLLMEKIIKKNMSILVKRIKKDLLNSENPFDQLVLIRFLENSAMRTKLIESDQKFNKSLYEFKYNFFKKLYKKGIAVEYSIYNLVLLGDFNEDYLWWIVL